MGDIVSMKAAAAARLSLASDSAFRSWGGNFLYRDSILDQTYS